MNKFLRLLSIAVFALLAIVAVNACVAANEYNDPTEAQLIETLRAGSPAEKAIACKQLAIKGTKTSVPELAKLLSDEQLASWSRIALEAIPDPAADAALVDAAKTLKGELLVGTINSIGVRRSTDAFDVLSGRLKDSDHQVAAASAVALGHIGDAKATTSLRAALTVAEPAVRSAVAEGCILCAERLLADGKNDEAAAIYDQVRKAEVPKQRVLEATRGVIVARGTAGIPLLAQLLRSSDRKEFALALMVARELKGQGAGDALVAEVTRSSPERAALIVTAIGDRGGASVPPLVTHLATTASSDKQVRLAAIHVLGRLGNVSTVPNLLEVAQSDDEELSQAAKAALAALPGDEVSADLAHRLPAAKGKTLGVLIELAGERRIDVAKELVNVLHDSDQATRNAALVALGATAGPKDLELLVSEMVGAKNTADAELAERALKTACVRMPDREATAAQLAATMPKAPAAAKASLLRILGAMGGPKALETIAAAVKNDDPELQDVGTRVLGEWMTADAAPVLLEITKSSTADKFKVRAVRGYLRIARQQKMSDAERLKMFHEALTISERPEERQLALDILKRCPSAESVQLASSFLDDQELRPHAVETAIFIAEKIKDKDPAASKSAAEKALKAEPNGKFADRARALTNTP